MKRRSVARIAFPAESRLGGELRGTDYHDAFEAELTDPGVTPAEIFSRLLRATPAWVELLVGLRDRIVSVLGLKQVGELAGTGTPAPTTYKPGDRLSIFTVRTVDDTEIVVGIDDTHLDVRMSCLKRLSGGRPVYVLATLVRTHNRLGRLYMLPVGPFHRLIVRIGMRRLEV